MDFEVLETYILQEHNAKKGPKGFSLVAKSVQRSLLSLTYPNPEY